MAGHSPVGEAGGEEVGGAADLAASGAGFGQGRLMLSSFIEQRDNGILGDSILLDRGRGNRSVHSVCRVASHRVQQHAHTGLSLSEMASTTILPGCDSAFTGNFRQSPRSHTR